MANFEGTTFGVMSRVSADLAVPEDSLYGGVASGLRFDALPIHFDHAAWLRQFGERWPAGSDAHASYQRRIVRGPEGFTLAHAARDLTTRRPGR